MPPTKAIEDGEDTILILITTDNHVGYHENDPIRGDDSWITFQEILHIARERDVDMVVQSGDLFHVNKPSKKSMYQVMRLLKQYCLSDRECEIELLSDPRGALGNEFSGLNYEDPNINVGMPFFAISGNHDDATGEGFLLPLDLLLVSGLINHFGKVKNNEDIVVSPLLLQKGSTRLALYGLASVKDERLHRIFRDGKVKFQRPINALESWFNMLCVHQNHAAHSKTSFLPEQFLPNFLDFVIWGHEHECIPNPIFNPETGFDTLQPGSSVATSLCEAETAEKHVFIMKIKGTSYSIEPIRLNTIRPFIMSEVSLQKEGFIAGPASKDDISKFLSQTVNKLIKQAEKEWVESFSHVSNSFRSPSKEGQVPLPLIRLRVEYSGDYEVENPRRFSNKFVGKIANTNDVVHYFKRKQFTNESSTRFDKNLHNAPTEKPSELRLQDIVKSFLNQMELNLIPEDGMSHAVKKFVENEDKYVLNEFIRKEIDEETKIFLNMNINTEEYSSRNSDPKKLFKTLLTQIKTQKEQNDHQSEEPEHQKKSKERVTYTNRSQLDSVNKSQAVKEPRHKMQTRASKTKQNNTKLSNEIVISDDSDDSYFEEEQEASDNLLVEVIVSDDDSDITYAPEKSTRKEKAGKAMPQLKTNSTRRKNGNTKASASASKHNNNTLLDDLMSMGS